MIAQKFGILLTVRQFSQINVVCVMCRHEMLPKHSSGVATLQMFRMHVAKNLRLVGDDENDHIK